LQPRSPSRNDIRSDASRDLAPHAFFRPRGFPGFDHVDRQARIQFLPAPFGGSGQNEPPLVRRFPRPQGVVGDEKPA
jgi:hypothetical protein